MNAYIVLSKQTPQTSKRNRQLIGRSWQAGRWQQIWGQINTLDLHVAPKVLHSGCCGWRHNYYSQQRQAGQANEQSTSIRCMNHVYFHFECFFYYGKSSKQKILVSQFVITFNKSQVNLHKCQFQNRCVVLLIHYVPHCVGR